MRLGLAADLATRALDQPPLGFGHRAAADQHHPRTGNPVEERQTVHASHSGMRSASMIALGAIRSATTAKRSPSTSTSATKPREL